MSIVAEHFVRLLQHCGMPGTDVDFLHGDGRVVGQILKDAPVRSTLFTGSQAVAEHLVLDLKGKVRVTTANTGVETTKCTRTPMMSFAASLLALRAVHRR